MSTQGEKTPSRPGQFLRSETLIGSLVALLSILTALIGYQASTMDSRAGEHALNAQRTLSEANREYLNAGQISMQDFISYDNYYASLDDDPEAAENYYASLSNLLVENLNDLDRDLFDEIYENQLYELSDSCFVEADALFELEQLVGGVADQYQLIMFVFATGLAMAAWASLLKETSNMRTVFVFFALAMLIYGSLLFLGNAAEAAEILSISATTDCLQTLTNYTAN